MRAQVLRLCIAGAAAFALAVPIQAKAPLERITITGGGLGAEVTLADPEILALSNPWRGRIANWTVDVAPPPDDRPIYEIALHARLRDPETKPIYHLRYAKGRRGRPGQRLSSWSRRALVPPERERHLPRGPRRPLACRHSRMGSLYPTSAQALITRRAAGTDGCSRRSPRASEIRARPLIQVLVRLLASGRAWTT